MPGRNVSRRMVMGILGSGIVAAPIVAEAIGEEAPASADRGPAAPDMQGAANLVAPLKPGSRLARWTLVEVAPVDLGAVVVTLRGDDGHDFRVEILARDTSPLAARPPAQTERFALHVCNGGDGWLPTVEEQGLAAMTLAQIVASNERTVAVGGLLTHADRIARHRDAMLAPSAPSTPAY
jgi:hypothetical protein